MADFREIVSSKKPVLIDFFAEWCGPCKTLAPILKELATELGDDVVIIKIDIDKNKTLAQKLNVRSVPTLMIYKEESLLWRQSGVVPKFQLMKALKEFK
jgi:thioredoxin 1|tara:strand:+ start:198 stop:494 length:297 start_codon:yes stop_codon:yes gene_type:complete